MDNVAIDDEAVACVGDEFGSGFDDLDAAADDVDELVVRVAVGGADPALLKSMADEHEVGGVGEDLADHAGFGVEEWGGVCFYERHDGFQCKGIRV